VRNHAINHREAYDLEDDKKRRPVELSTQYTKYFEVGRLS